MNALLLTNESGTYDIINLTGQIAWSGDYQQCVRALEFTMLTSATDANVPAVSCSVGDAVSYYVDGDLKFSGYVFTRQKSTSVSVMTLKCYDRGIYLKKSSASYAFSSQTSEAIARKICADYGITVGGLATTGANITRNFFGSKLYDIIQTAYSLASETTGEKYYQVFKDDKLYVLKKEITAETIIIEGGSNLMEASTTESIENMINQVVIYDADNNYVKTINDAEAVKTYGVLQSYLRQTSDDDKLKAAQKLIDDNGVSQKITLQNLGNINNVTGGTVVVHEPYTGLYGLFYIDSDVHTWKNGQYYNKLVVNFKSIMDEKEVGSLPSVKSSSSSSSSATSESKKTYTYTPITKDTYSAYKASQTSQ